MPRSPDREKIQETAKKLAQKGGVIGFDEGDKPIVVVEAEIKGRKHTRPDFISTGKSVFVREQRSGTPGIISIREGKLPTLTVDELRELESQGLISPEDAKEARKAIARGRIRTSRKKGKS